MLRLRKVEAIKIHHLVPRTHKVTHKRLLRVVTCIDFREGSELGVRTENEVGGGTGPLELTRPVIDSLEHAFGCGGRLPRRVHVEQIHEEIMGQRPGPLGEDTEFGLPDVCIQDTHTADEHRHLGSGQRQHVCPIHQQLRRRSLVSVCEVVAEPV